MQKLKIGFVFDDSLDRHDGVQQYVKTLGKWLMEQGHNVKFLVGETHNAGDFQPHVFSLSKNMKISANKNTLTMPLPTSGKKIQQVLDEEKFDVLHIQIPYSPFMGGKVISKASKNTAIVGTFHIVGSTSFEKYGSYGLSMVQSATLKKIHKIMFVSTAAKEFGSSYYHVKSDLIIPNMVDVEIYKKTERTRKSKKTRIVFVGRLVERKGCGHLLEALALLSDEAKKDLEVQICGDGELRDHLEARSKELGLDIIVEFFGYIEEHDKPQYLADADIAVFPSYEGESFGIVLIEAMAAGHPVVLGGDNSGYRTVMAEKSKQLIVDVKNHQLFAKKLRHLINSHKTDLGLVEWQKNRVKDFDVAHVGPEILKIYKETILELGQ